MGKISNSGKDERGQYHGGKAGDQTSQEWCTRDWYDRPWTAVLRHPDPEVREMIASHSEKAAANDNIGYDQWERTTFWTELSKVGYDPAAITIPCESDCSAGVAAIVKAVGFLKGIEKLQNVPETMYTGNEKKYLKNAGFECYTDPKYLKSDSELVRGDILLYHNSKNQSGHTAIYLSNSTEIQNGGKSIDELAQEVIAGKWGNGDERKSRLESSGYNYQEVQNKVNEILKPQKPAENPKYKVVARSGLNVRPEPNTNKPPLRVLSNGSNVRVVGISNGWAQLEGGGYVSANYIQKV